MPNVIQKKNCGRTRNQKKKAPSFSCLEQSLRSPTLVPSCTASASDECMLLLFQKMACELDEQPMRSHSDSSLSGAAHQTNKHLSV